MQGTSWTSILRMIPVEQHAKLVLITHNNTEIHLQGIVYQDRDFLVVRGRLAASTDSGRVFFLPFDQVHYLAFRDPMTEVAVQAMLGLEPSESPQTAAVVKETVVEEAARETQTPTPVPGVSAGHNSTQVAKAALLDRLRRARAQDSGPKTATL